MAVLAVGKVSRHPEWKALYDALMPLINKGEVSFDYDVLSKLAGIDICSTRGRAQFYKCRKEILEKHRIWLENQSAVGYNVIPAGEHFKAAKKRVKQAGRKVKLAKDINEHTDETKLSQEQRIARLTMSATLQSLSKAFLSMSRKLKVESSPKRIKIELPKWE
jgi:hypothetical protein